MSLINSLNSTFSGLKTVEAKMSTVSSNVTNADKVGYTTKDYQSDYLTVSGTTTPSGGVVVGSLSKELYAATIGDYSNYAYSSTVAEYLDLYSTKFGGIDGSTSLSANVDDLQAQLDALAASPSDSSAKTNVVDAAETIVNTLNSLSESLQGYRQEVDQQIAVSVDTINTSLKAIESLNQQISTLQAQGLSTANLEDERMVQLTNLSEQMDVSYFMTSGNQLKIYTTGGQPLLDSAAHEVSYTASSSVSSSTSFSAITLNGKDITSSVEGGKLGGYIALRDTYFVEEQQKLDEFAQTLADTLNTISNSGASYPARATLTGDVTDNTATDSFSATGAVRITTINDSGIVQGTTDFDLSAYSNIGDLVNALDALTGVAASLDTNGCLVLSAENANQGIAMNQLTSDVAGQSFSSAFGLNNVFSGDTAASIKISTYLQSNPEYLATGVLSDTAGLAAGDRGVSSGNGTTATGLANALSGKAGFDSAGNFVSQTTTLSSYATKIISDIASRSSNATDQSDITESLYTQTKSLLDNAQGVNLDEQTVRLTALQTQYQSAASLIAAIKDMFDDLITAVR